MRKLFFATLLTLSTVSALTTLDVARTIEGLFYGILEDEYKTDLDLTGCLKSVDTFEVKVSLAVTDLESLTFSGVKDGLREAGEAVQLIPELVKDCK
jgi:hypothetical protein